MMKLPKEELQQAAKLASVIAQEHSIQSFTRIWMLDGAIHAFNGQVGIRAPVQDLPVIGGIDGKVLVQLLDAMVDEEVELSADDHNLSIKGDDSYIELNIMDMSAYIDAFPKEARPYFECPVGALQDIQLDALINLKEVKGDPAPDFGCLSILPGGERLVLMASDRATLNRNFWAIENAAEIEKPVFIPLEFFKLLNKMGDAFAEGQLAITDNLVIVRDGDDWDGVLLYCRLIDNPTPIDLQGAIARIWPDGKFKKSLLVPIPDGFREAVNKAVVLGAGKDDLLTLKVAGRKLTILGKGSSGKFTDTLKLEADHANVEVRVSVPLLKRALPNVDRMWVGPRAMALFGPLRFSVFISTR